MLTSINKTLFIQLTFCKLPRVFILYRYFRGQVKHFMGKNLARKLKTPFVLKRKTYAPELLHIEIFGWTSYVHQNNSNWSEIKLKLKLCVQHAPFCALLFTSRVSGTQWGQKKRCLDLLWRLAAGPLSAQNLLVFSHHGWQGDWLFCHW